ncbi:hypothetical protein CHINAEXTREME_18830 [Halobiforma lacisalsi AJ5]|uniref:SnoaL-like domain-containing protein n=1 Tax=Natronobacterium lacisalsi AJ5 TaxID=358396 RepID=M0LRM5_NATLA|nr:nuclear transport factor 2 family protein [Halobiforma lacisalsi]APW99698.1 hypothetical protein CHINAEXTREME_18830 [Halobiforma lacisalsi AJ5]EMA36131.1 hypothetical protein C445_04718 [Halobiforma lacisalsi AJ5]
MTTSTREAIHRLKYDYCYTIDDGDYDRWVSLFTEDGRFVLEGQQSYEGHEELQAFATGTFDSLYDYTAHFVANSVVELESDDTATGRWYLLLCYRDADGNEGWRQGRYVDEYRRVDEGWRIAESRASFGLSGEF